MEVKKEKKKEKKGFGPLSTTAMTCRVHMQRV